MIALALPERHAALSGALAARATLPGLAL